MEYCNMVILAGWFLLVATSVAGAGVEFPVYHIIHSIYTTRNDSSLFNQSKVVAAIDNPTQFKYMVEFQIGTPPVKVSAVLDTGSSFTWIPARSFDSSKSTSYQLLKCVDPKCDFEGRDCMIYSTKKCTYYAVYAGGRESFGVVGEDILSLQDDVSFQNPISIGRLLFGVDMTNRTDSRGVLGLGVEYKGGFLSQLDESDFSICLPLNYPDSSFLRIGGKAILEGNYTELSVMSNHYTFDIRAISVAGCVTQIPTGDSDVDGKSRLIFDTGASLTHLHPAVMKIVKEEMEKAVDKPSVSDPNGNYEFCYPERDLEIISGFTRRFKVQFQFPDGNWLPLAFTHTWSHVSDFWCFAFLTSSDNTNRNVFGSWQMRGINFGFEPSAKRLYYQSGC